MKENVSAVIEAIVHHQEMVLGPLALEQAKKVNGLKFTDDGSVSVSIKSGKEKELLFQLVKKYEDLFGLASVEVCKDAVKEAASDYPEDKLPDILKS